MRQRLQSAKMGTASVLCLLLVMLPLASVEAAPTPNTLRGGIVINEVLIDPNSSTLNFDTDGNGTAATEDEFVEIYNLSGSTIDISGLELWDAGNDNWFTFPASTTLGAGSYAVVVGSVQSGGSLLSLSPGNLAFDAAHAGGIINNSGDNVLYDPVADEYIQLLYNGDSADSPPSEYTGFSATSSLVGTVEDWGTDVDGVSLVRELAGDQNVVRHNTVSAENASPGGPSVSDEPPTDIMINEVDADTLSTDELEFVELYDGGDGSTDLTGLALVFYNGADDESHSAFDLDGYSTDANGYLVVGNSGVTGVDRVFSNDTLQNGADAVALYLGDATDIPNDTPVTTTHLLDALVYDTDDADDPGLLILLNDSDPQVDEDGSGDKDDHSNQRCPNGTGGQRNTSSYIQASPTPGAENCTGFGDCGDPATFIYDIQGSGLTSPISGTTT